MCQDPKEQNTAFLEEVHMMGQLSPWAQKYGKITVIIQANTYIESCFIQDVKNYREARWNFWKALWYICLTIYLCNTLVWIINVSRIRSINSELTQIFLPLPFTSVFWMNITKFYSSNYDINVSLKFTWCIPWNSGSRVD